MGMALSPGRADDGAIDQFQPVYCLHNCRNTAVNHISVDTRRLARQPAGWSDAQLAPHDILRGCIGRLRSSPNNRWVSFPMDPAVKAYKPSEGRMSAETNVPVVVGAGDRILGYDLARSFALLGMIVVHFGLVMAADPSRPVWATEVMKFLDGRAAATFVVLAGVGLSLRSRRAVAAGDLAAISEVRRVLVRRGLFLLAIGFANLAIWPGDILRVYGVSLIVASRFITTSSRSLLLASAAFVLGFVALFLVLDYDKHWDWDTMTYHGLWTLEGLSRNLFYDGFRSVFPWTGFLLFGMWLGRQDLQDRTVGWRFALLGAGVALLAEVTSRLLVEYFLASPYAMAPESVRACFGTESMPPLPLFILTAGGTAVVVIALSVRVAKSQSSAPWLAPLVATGQMALTLYFAHIVIGLGIIVISGLATSQTLPVSQGCGVIFFALAVLVSALWKKRFRHGPLEWVMRRVAG
jgi:uncharacterized protein